MAQQSYTTLVSSLFLIILITLTTTIFAANTSITTPYLPTDNGYFFHVLTTVNCPTKCTSLTKYNFIATTSTSTSYGFSSAFISMRLPDSTIQFISSNKGSSFPKDRTNTLNLVDPSNPSQSISLTTPVDSITIQSTFYVIATSASSVSRLKTATLSIILSQQDNTIVQHDETIALRPPVISDLNVYNNTIAVKHPIFTESFQFMIDTHQNPLSTSLYIPLTVTGTDSKPLRHNELPPISTQIDIISPTEFSFLKINLNEFTYPTTHQPANCFLNNFPINATISSNGAKLSFTPVLGDIIGLIMREGPVIACRDIHIRNYGGVGDTIQYKFTSLIVSATSTIHTLETRIINGQIETHIATSYNNTQASYPVGFYSGVIPQMVLGTTFYQPIDISTIDPANRPTNITTGTMDMYLFDIEYPYPNAELILEPEIFNLIQDHKYTTSAFQSFGTGDWSSPKSTQNGYNLMTKNIVKVINPYKLTNAILPPLPNTIPHIYTSPTINITRTPTWNEPLTQSYFSPYIDLWGKHLEALYSPHFTIAYTNFVNGITTPNSSVQTLNLTLALTPLVSSVQKMVTISYRSLPSLFPDSLIPQQKTIASAFSRVGEKLDFTISGTWFAPHTPFQQAKISSRLGKTYFTGDFRSCSATLISDHTQVKMVITIPQETFELPDVSDDDEQRLYSYNNNSVDLEHGNVDITMSSVDIDEKIAQSFFFHTQTEDISNISKTNTISIFFDEPVYGDVRIVCLYAFRQVNQVNQPQKQQQQQQQQEEEIKPHQQQQHHLSTTINTASSSMTPQQQQQPTPPPVTSVWATKALDLDLITIGTDHYGTIQDMGFITGDIFTALWHPLHATPTDPTVPDDPVVPPIDPNPKEDKGLSAGVIVLIVMGSIVGEILLAIGCFYGIKWGRVQYKAYLEEQAKYQQQQDAFEATKVDVIEITKTNNKKKRIRR